MRIDPVTGEGLAVVAGTIDRPFAVERLVRSVAARFPKARIYIGDQGGLTEPMGDFYERYGVAVASVPYDAGVAAARNAAVDLITESAFLLCDDDFILTEETDVTDAARLLDAAPELGVVGGRLLDGRQSGDDLEWRQRYWELFMFLDRRSRLLTTCPMRLHAPAMFTAGDVRHYRCDAVMNWALMRTEMFTAGVGWDERYTCNGEHEDFYLALKEETEWRVAYLPSMTARHHHPPNPYYAVRRDRSEGWRRLAEKWGFDRHLEIGLGLRLASAPDNLIPETSLTQTAMFAGRDKIPLGETRRAGAFRRARNGAMEPTTAFDEVGERIDRSEAVSLRAKITSDGTLQPVRRVGAQMISGRPSGEVEADRPSFQGIHMLSRACARPGSVLDLRIMPVGWEIASGEAVDVEVTASWRMGGRTIAHRQPVSFFASSAPEREWSAISLNAPLVEGLLTLVLDTNCRRGRATASTEIVVTGERALGENVFETLGTHWVNGWSHDPRADAAGYFRAFERRYAAFPRCAEAAFQGWRIEVVEAPKGLLADAPETAWLELAQPPFPFGPGRVRTRLAPHQTRARLLIARRLSVAPVDLRAPAVIEASLWAPRLATALEAEATAEAQNRAVA